METKTSAAQLKAVKKYKEKVKRITIDFYPTDEDLWNYIQNQPKKQTYIKELIRRDLAAKFPGKYITFDKDNYFIFEVDDID